MGGDVAVLQLALLGVGTSTATGGFEYSAIGAAIGEHLGRRRLRALGIGRNGRNDGALAGQAARAARRASLAPLGITSSVPDRSGK